VDSKIKALYENSVENKPSKKGLNLNPFFDASIDFYNIT
jgi:hypothetical protein